MVASAIRNDSREILSNNCGLANGARFRLAVELHGRFMEGPVEVVPCR
jgi:hypothetical protein